MYPLKKKEILPLTTRWMNLKVIILGEISQPERDAEKTNTILYHLHVKSGKKERKAELIEREENGSCQGLRRLGETQRGWCKGVRHFWL